jgi:hypothetical protein
MRVLIPRRQRNEGYNNKQLERRLKGVNFADTQFRDRSHFLQDG